jgi:AcrR family transcriptional regulator
MGGGRRARSAREKADRSASLVRAARELLSGASWGAVSVEGIARRAGVAKGTVFLYYRTKEALGLAVVAELLREWWAELEERVDSLERPCTPSTVAAAARRSLEGRVELLRLVGLMAGVLEANAGEDAVREFRSNLLEGAQRLGGRLEAALPFLRRGEGTEIALTLHALMIGIHQMAPDRTDAALRSPELAPFRVDVPGAVGRTLRVQLEGARAVAGIGSGPAR